VIVEEAKIQKTDSVDRASEAELKGHLEVQISEAIKEAKKNQLKDDNMELYEEDYQLARAVDLLRGISVYQNLNVK
jgi:carboxyl-terminal processing protease